MSALSEKLLTVSKPFLGPAAESFLSRQCKGHLKVDVNDVTASQLAELAKWIEVGAGLIMDQAKAAALAKQIANLK